MTSTRTPKVTPKVTPKTPTDESNKQGLIASSDGFFMCVISMEYLERLGALFGGIVAASNADSVPMELAKLGKHLVADYHNEMDCYREDYEYKAGLGALSKGLV